MVSPSENSRRPRRQKTHLLEPCLTSIVKSEALVPRQNPPASSPPPDLKALSSSVTFNGWRFASKNFRSWAKKMSDLHEPTWRKAGIFEAVMASTYKIHKNHALIFALVEKWCPNTISFVFPWGQARITLQDVMVLLGFSVKGSSPRSASLDSKVEKTKEKLEKECLKIKKDKRFPTNEVAWISRFMDSGDELEHEAFLALWLSYFVFPTCYYHISEDSFPIAVHLSRGTMIALAPSVLAHLYAELTLLKTHISAFNESTIPLQIDLTALFKLVQVWAWERFKELQPKPNPMLKGDQPRLARWHYVKQRTDDASQILDNSKIDSSEWRLKKKYSDVEDTRGDASERLGKRSKLELDSNDSGPLSQNLALIRANGDKTLSPPVIKQRSEETDEKGKSIVPIPSDENKSSDPAVGFDEAIDILISIPETRHDDTMDGGSKEPECLLGAIVGEKQRSDEKEDDDSLIQNWFALEELPLAEDNNESSPCQKEDDVVDDRSNQKNLEELTLMAANNESDTKALSPSPLDFDDIVVREACNDELHLYGSNADMINDGVAGEKARSDGKLCSEAEKEDDDRSNQKKLEELANNESGPMVLSPQETRQTCDCDDDMMDGGSKEPECLLLHEKLCSEGDKEDDDSLTKKGKELALAAENNESSPCQKLASGSATGDETSKAHESTVLNPSHETNSSDPPVGFDDIVVVPPETRETFNDSSEELKCFPQEDDTIAGEKARSDEKDVDDRSNQKKLEELALKVSDESNIDVNEGITVGGGNQGQNCLVHDNGLRSEETPKSTVQLEKSNDGVGTDCYGKRLHEQKVMLESIQEHINKAQANVAWFKERRAIKQRNEPACMI